MELQKYTSQESPLMRFAPKDGNKSQPITQEIIELTREFMKDLSESQSPPEDCKELAQRITNRVSEEIGASWSSKFLSAMSNLFSSRVSNAHLLLRALNKDSLKNLSESLSKELKQLNNIRDNQKKFNLLNRKIESIIADRKIESIIADKNETSNLIGSLKEAKISVPQIPLSEIKSGLQESYWKKTASAFCNILSGGVSTSHKAFRALSYEKLETLIQEEVPSEKKSDLSKEIENDIKNCKNLTKDQRNKVLELLKKVNSPKKDESREAQQTEEISDLKSQLESLKIHLKTANEELEKIKASTLEDIKNLKSELQQKAEMEKALTRELGNLKSQLENQPKPEDFQKLIARISNLKSQLTETTKNKENVEAELKQTQAELKETTAQCREAEKRGDALLARSGQSHIKRDWRRMNGNIPFPAGDDLKEKFDKPFLQIESFFCDVITAIQNLDPSLKNSKEKDQIGAQMLVHQIISPLYERCKNYIDKAIKEKLEYLKQGQFEINLGPRDDPNDINASKDFFLMHTQISIPKLIEELSNEEVEQIINGASVSEDSKDNHLVLRTHQKMLELAKLPENSQDSIADTDNDLRIPQVAHTLLLLMTYAELSDPICFIEPAPGTTLSYHRDQMVEVLSPGAKNHGLIKEGDKVEVVFPGLYFNKPNGDLKDPPVVKPRVRRILNPNTTAENKNESTESSSSAHKNDRQR